MMPVQQYYVLLALYCMAQPLGDIFCCLRFNGALGGGGGGAGAGGGVGSGLWEICCLGMNIVWVIKSVLVSMLVLRDNGLHATAVAAC